MKNKGRNRKRQAKETTETSLSSDDEQLKIVKHSDDATPDISQIDPVKEFGFISIGHEFDGYPRHKIRDIADWNWFLDELTEAAGDDGESDSKSRGRKKTRREGKDSDDEDWTGESEDTDAPFTGVESISHRPHTYAHTRSKDKNRRQKGKLSSRRSVVTDRSLDEEDDDETLGGFIVHDDDLQEQELQDNEGGGTESESDFDEDDIDD